MDKSREIPEPHSNFLKTSVIKLQDDQRIKGCAAGGSYIYNEMDEFSDLDLIIVTNDDEFEQVLIERKSIAENIGPLLESFSGEHVGEPRLLICLYGPPLLHVDLKFISLKDFAIRVENPVILWERDALLTKALHSGTACYPQPDLHWIENRFWVWVHYIAGKIARGELFDAIESFSFLRSQVFGPLILAKKGARPQGVRKIEKYGAEYLNGLIKTLPAHDKVSCFNALMSAIRLYRRLRDDTIVDSNQRLIAEIENYVSEIGESIRK